MRSCITLPWQHLRMKDVVLWYMMFWTRYWHITLGRAAPHSIMYYQGEEGKKILLQCVAYSSYKPTVSECRKLLDNFVWQCGRKLDPVWVHPTGYVVWKSGPKGGWQNLNGCHPSLQTSFQLRKTIPNCRSVLQTLRKAQKNGDHRIFLSLKRKIQIKTGIFFLLEKKVRK